MAGDLTQEETIQKIFALVDEQMQGQLDILVNNAGWCPVQPITELTIAVWPWLLTMLGFLVLVTYWPPLSLWLPNLLMK